MRTGVGRVSNGAWAALLALLVATTAHAAFTDSGIVLPAMASSAGAWADYDNDGDLDFVLKGSPAETEIYRSSGGANPTFTPVGAGLVGLTNGSTSWGDYDNDGDLDLLVNGRDAGSVVRTILYRSSGGANPTFADAGVGLPGVEGRSVWADFENDGRLDIVLVGTDASATRTARVYRNQGGANPTFMDINAGLVGVGSTAAVACADYDNDGDPDIAISGDTGPTTQVTKVYRNNGLPTTFTDAGAPLSTLSAGSLDWGDYDNDGDLDLLFTGTTTAGSSAGSIARIGRNGGGPLTEIVAGLVDVSTSCAVWGDYDNDGFLDVVEIGTGSDGSTITRVSHSSGGTSPTFSNSGNALASVRNGVVAWADYDNDGDLDLLLSGQGTPNASKIYRNAGVPANTPPAVPAGLSAAVNGTVVTFHWGTANDAQTPNAALRFDLRTGTTPGGSQITGSVADAATGFRRIAALGTAGVTHQIAIRLPMYGVYYWSVQAVDGAFAGSPFAAEQTLQLEHMTDMGVGLPGVNNAAAAWGDYDGDGDLDIALTGASSGGDIAKVYRDASGAFEDAFTLGAEHNGDVAWGDYDNDGDLDLVVTGETGGLGGPITTTLYRNTGSGFTDAQAGLPGIRFGAVAWGDYDNDGDLDLALAGDTGAGYITRIYRNTAGSFADAGAGLTGVKDCALAWGDYDNDGDLDLVAAGSVVSTTKATTLYRNTGGSFADALAGLPGMDLCALAWGDYDADGDLDLAMTGVTTGNAARIYRNAGGVFTDIVAGLQSVGRGAVAWADYDGDGDLDLTVSGNSGSVSSTTVYRNSAGAFADATAGLPGNSFGSIGWGDYDLDSKPDALIAGQAEPLLNIARVYRNLGALPNSPPSAPTGLGVTYDETMATFRWLAATDDRTPQAGLHYNLRVGTTATGGEIVAPMANPTTGYRRVPQLGNAQQRLQWSIARTRLPAGPFYWSVQAIDASFAGSAWATTAVTGVEPRSHAGSWLLLEGRNPFRGEAELRYSLAAGARVDLAVFDVLGRRVRTLFRGDAGVGEHRARWDGRDASGASCAAGLYLVRLNTGVAVLVSRALKVE